MSVKICDIAKEFDVFGEFVAAAPCGTGHINDTYEARYNQGGRDIFYIHQRINHTIFKDPPAQMENIQRVTHHLHQRLKVNYPKSVARRSLTVVPTRQGHPYHIDATGGFWRTYVKIEDSYSVDLVDSPALARATGRAFGEFQSHLSDFAGPRLHETIPNFHHTPSRLDALIKAVENDAVGRVAGAKDEIQFALDRATIAPVLVDLQAAGDLPERIVHNDTKINNVLIDNKSHEGICIIDLDTVMPGLAHYDFGDMVRTVTSPAEEDEQDLSRVEMRMPYFQALAEGYLSQMAHILTPKELETLAFSGKLITYEIGIRFLSDHLNGDTYFKVHREGHNLDRCRTQFALIESIERQENEMQQAVLNIAAELLQSL